LPAPKPTFARPVLPPFGLGASNIFFDLAGRDAHDFDGVADHIGGALLAFRAGGHRPNLSVAVLDQQ